MKIIYVHHGNRAIKGKATQEDDLTDLGYRDCNLVAELLNNEKIKDNIKAIYSSNFFRCTKTAEIINTFLNVPIIEDDRLNEFGSIENESWVDAQKRIIDCLESIIKKFNADDVVICVTSGVNIAGFICKSFNIEPNNQVPFLGVPSCSPIIFNF